MDDKSFNIRVPKRWVRMGMVALVTAVIVAPLTAIAAHTFTDVPDTNTFHADIAWLKDAGVTLGCNPPANTQFCPKDNVTREQMSAFMRRLAENKVVDAATAVEAESAAQADTVVDGAITQSKIASGAVGTAQIADDAQGVALAGVQFSDTGTVVGWFNRFGGAPTVTNPATGQYTVAFPGLEGQLGPNALVIATDADDPPRHVRHFLAGSTNLVELRTYDLTGAAANSDVNLVVMAPNSIAGSGAGASEDAGG